MNKLLKNLAFSGLVLTLTTSCKNQNFFEEMTENVAKLPVYQYYFTGKVKGESKGDISNDNSKRRNEQDECYTIVLETEKGFKTFMFFGMSTESMSLIQLTSLDALVNEGDEIKILLESRTDPKNIDQKFDFFDAHYIKLYGMGSVSDRLHIQEVNGKKVNY